MTKETPTKKPYAHHSIRITRKFPEATCERGESASTIDYSLQVYHCPKAKRELITAILALATDEIETILGE